jgi:hypothetical protein
MAWIVPAFKGAAWLLRGALSFRGVAAAAIADEVITDGAGRRAVVDMATGAATETARDVASNLTGLNAENFAQIQRDFENGDWEALLSNNLVLAAVGLGSTALSMGVGGNGIIGSLFNGLLVAGALYAAQKYVLPMVFGNSARDPNAPAPVPVATPERVVPSAAEQPEPMM